MSSTIHTLDADKLFRAADYIGHTEDGRRIAGFCGYFRGRGISVNGVVCFEEGADGTVTASEKCLGKFDATQEMVDEFASELGLEKNPDKDGDMTLASSGVSCDEFYLLASDAHKKSVCIESIVQDIFCDVDDWRRIEGFSSYAMLNTLMLARQKLAAVDEALSKMQNKIAVQL